MINGSVGFCIAIVVVVVCRHENHRATELAAAATAVWSNSAFSCCHGSYLDGYHAVFRGAAARAFHRPLTIVQTFVFVVFQFLQISCQIVGWDAFHAARAFVHFVMAAAAGVVVVVVVLHFLLEIVPVDTFLIIIICRIEWRSATRCLLVDDEMRVQ